MIPITHFIALDDAEIVESFIRASGPGGQHVNTTASAVQLRFDALGSPSLPDDLKSRLPALAGQRMTRDGIVIITADAHRSQLRNRREALDRLVALLREAAVRPSIRRKTRPSRTSKLKRLEAKSRRAGIKADRRAPTD